MIGMGFLFVPISLVAYIGISPEKHNAVAGIVAVAVIGWPRLAQGTPASGWLAMPAAAVACSAVYVVIGMLVLALAAGYQLADHSS